MQLQTTPDFTIKTVLVGETGVGKSALLERFCQSSFHLDYAPTIGIDVAMRLLRVDGKLVKHQVWDTAGQERFRSLTSSYYRCAQVVFIVFDVCNRSSFLAVPKWIEDVKHHSSTELQLVLLANKADGTPHAVPRGEIQALADLHDLRWLSTSAKNNINVTAAFEVATSLYLGQQQHREAENALTLAPSPPPPKAARFCCSG